MPTENFWHFINLSTEPWKPTDTDRGQLPLPADTTTTSIPYQTLPNFSQAWLNTLNTPSGSYMSGSPQTLTTVWHHFLLGYLAPIFLVLFIVCFATVLFAQLVVVVLGHTIMYIEHIEWDGERSLWLHRGQLNIFQRESVGKMLAKCDIFSIYYNPCHHLLPAFCQHLSQYKARQPLYWAKCSQNAGSRWWQGL